MVLSQGSDTIGIATSGVTSTHILNSTILNEDIANSTINLTQKVTGILPIANGGTNSSATPTANSIMIGNGTAIVPHTVLGASLPLFTDANGLPTTTGPAVQGYWTRDNTNGWLHNTTLTDNVGIGIAYPTQKLDVDGQVRIRGGAPAAGKVLTATDTDGNASWQSPGSHFYSLPNTGSSTQWIKLGTLTIPQNGYSVFFTITSNSDYNAQSYQNFEVHNRFKTSNNSSTDANGFKGDATYYTTGEDGTFGTSGRIKFKAVSANEYELYMEFSTYTGSGSFYSVETTGGSWIHSGATGQSDPGAVSSSVLIPTQEFNVRANSLLVDETGNVGIGTDDPQEKLHVEGYIVSPEWPAFNVYNSSGGDQSTTGRFNATVETFDNGNNFNLTTDEFVAPIKGIYQFNWTCYSNSTGGRTFLYVNGSAQIQTNSNDKSIAITLSLNAGDKVYLGGNSSFTMRWYGAYAHNSFSGYLVMGL